MTAMDASMIDFMPAKKPTMRRTSLNTCELLLRSTGDLTYAHRRKTLGRADVGTAKAPAGADAGTAKAQAGADAGTATTNAPAGGDAREANMQTDPTMQWTQRRLHRYTYCMYYKLLEPNLVLRGST